MAFRKFFKKSEMKHIDTGKGRVWGDKMIKKAET